MANGCRMGERVARHALRHHNAAGRAPLGTRDDRVPGRVADPVAICGGCVD